MGKCTRRCEKVGEVAVMDVAHGNSWGRDAEVTSSGSCKRRKVDSEEATQANFLLEHQCCCAVALPEDSISPAASGTFDSLVLSVSSSHESGEVAKSCNGNLDLKEEGSETEVSNFSNGGGFSKESSHFCVDSNQMQSTAVKKPVPTSSPQKQSASKMPSAAEIEEFFVVSEQCEQERFTAKYNYDIVKDVPLDGRYEWMRLKP